MRVYKGCHVKLPAVATYLPSSAELPDSDDTPVDNELQNLVPNAVGDLWL